MEDFEDSMRYGLSHFKRDANRLRKPGEIPPIHRNFRENLPERIECTRAEFAERMGIWPAPDVIGICIVAPDRQTILTEFLFTDEPYQPGKFLTRPALKEIAELERLYKL